MLMMKACPRCSGDLARMRDADEGDAMLSCMQCGYASYGRTIVSANTLVAVAGGPRSEYDLDAIEERASAAA
jgi:hypothetical protein